MATIEVMGKSIVVNSIFDVHREAINYNNLVDEIIDKRRREMIKADDINVNQPFEDWVKDLGVDVEWVNSDDELREYLLTILINQKTLNSPVNQDHKLSKMTLDLISLISIFPDSKSMIRHIYESSRSAVRLVVDEKVDL